MTVMGFKKMRTLIMVLGLILLPSLSLAAELSATVDRNKIGLQDTLELNVRLNKQVIDQPDFAQLRRDFDVLSNGQSTQYRNINGRAEAWTQWTLSIAPKTVGKLLIPSFEYQGSFSDAINIEVSDTASNIKKSEQPVYVETEVDNTSVFVQQQILLTMRLVTSVGITSLQADELKVDNAIIKKVAEHQFQRTINGKAHAVVEIAYAIYPQQSGNLEIPSTLWTIGLQATPRSNRDPFGSFGNFSNTKRIRLRTDEKNIQVLAQPRNYDGTNWLPAKNINLSQSWSQSPDTFKVGEPITRTIAIKVDGLTAAQIPQLEVKAGTYFKIYPDKPESKEEASPEGVTTHIEESYAIVPNKSGKQLLPAVVLQWWDTDQRKMREASLPAQEITVSEAEGVSLPLIPQAALPNNQTPANNEQATAVKGLMSDTLWLMLTLILSLTTIGFFLLWRKAKNQTIAASGTKKTSTASPNENAAFNQLKLSLQKNEHDRARPAIINWAQAYFDEIEFPTLQAVIEQSESEELRNAISQWDQSLYGDHADNVETTKAGKRVLVAIENIRRQKQPRKDTEAKLQPLYKN